MTQEEYKKITELEYKAKQCRAAGIDPEIDDGTAWAMTHTRECRMVTDGAAEEQDEKERRKSQDVNS